MYVCIYIYIKSKEGMRFRAAPTKSDRSGRDALQSCSHNKSNIRKGCASELLPDNRYLRKGCASELLPASGHVRKGCASELLPDNSFLRKGCAS